MSLLLSDKVGIYIPTYNKDEFIARTIESILNQTYKNFILTIVDNASTDNTEEIVKNFLDERINYIKNEKNIGAIKNINKCFELAIKDDVKYIAVYHSDDEYVENILEKEMNFLHENDEVKVVFTDSIIINESGKIISDDTNEFIKDNKILDYKKLLYKNLISGTPLVCPTFMCKSEILKMGYQFDEKYVYAGDTEYYLRISKLFRIGVLEDQLIRYRVSSGQETQMEYKENNLREEFKVLNHEIIYYQNNFGNIESDIMKIYKKKLADEYLRVAMNLLEDYQTHSRKISSYVVNSLNCHEYSILNKMGIKQKMLKYKLYFILKALKKCFHIISK